MITGFTCGAFDLLHTGHLFFLEQCKQECDVLIVGLHSDPTIDRPHKNKPIQTMFERYQQLMACRYVTNVIPYDTERDLSNMMSILPISIRFIGEDHIANDITGQDICDHLGISIRFVSRTHTYSSSELRSRLK
jgi:glycerol-3-phosphate cytidylyltransferase